jgi:thioesterase domain-containing protein
MAVRMLAEVEREQGVVVPLTTLFQGAASVRELAAAISHQHGLEDAGAPEAVTIFFIHPHLGTVPSMRHFTGPLGPGYRIEVRCPDQLNGRIDVSRSIEDLTRPLMESVRASQPSGPYVIAGHSIGGLFAYELARQLIAGGERVAWLGMLDSASSTVLGKRPARRQLLVHYARRGPRVLLEQCRSALRRELQELRVRLHPDPYTFDHRGARLVASHYAPTGLDGHLAVFATDAMVIDQRFGPTLGWDSVHRGTVEIHRVPGTHHSLLLQPHVEEVADTFARSLRACLEHQEGR